MQFLNNPPPSGHILRTGHQHRRGPHNETDRELATQVPRTQGHRTPRQGERRSNFPSEGQLAGSEGTWSDLTPRDRNVKQPQRRAPRTNTSGVPPLKKGGSMQCIQGLIKWYQ